MIKIRNDLSLTSLDGELVLMDLASGKYFGLNSTGSRMFALMQEGGSLSGILDVLVREYDAPRDVLEKDLENLARDLKARGLAECDEV